MMINWKCLACGYIELADVGPTQCFECGGVGPFDATNGTTVREMIERLQKCDPDALVVMIPRHSGPWNSPCRIRETRGLRDLTGYGYWLEENGQSMESEKSFRGAVDEEIGEEFSFVALG